MTTLTFEDPSYKIDATKEDGCKLSLTVFVSPEQTKKAYRKAIKKVNKQISIPGFRKGRAPDASVISRYGSYVEQEWKDILIQESVQGSFDLTKIYPVSKELLDRPKLNKCDKEEGAEIAFSYEHYPEVPEINFADLSVPKAEKKPFTQEQVDGVVKEVQKANADWEDIEGRGAEEGDHVVISIDSIEPASTIVKDRRLPVEEGELAPWLIKLIVGMKPEDVTEGMTEGENPTKIKVTLHKVQKILLPELNDELAKKAGADSEKDLVSKIEHNLNAEAEEECKQAQIKAVEDALIEKYTFDLPASIVKAEKEMRQKEEASQENIDELVDRSLRLYFLNKQIAQQGNISLTQEELNNELVRHMTQNPQFFGNKMDKETSQKLVSHLTGVLMERKTKDYALSQLTN